jgi:hypothetical protein
MSCRHVLRCSMVYTAYTGFSLYRGNMQTVRCGCRAGFRFLLPLIAYQLLAAWRSAYLARWRVHLGQIT